MKRFTDYVRYKYDQFLSLGTLSLILGLLFILLVIIGLVSLVMVLFFPDDTILELAWLNFLRTLDPGTLAGDEGSGLYILFLTISTFVGIFIFSLFISFILNGFQEKLETLRKGRSKVIERNHTVILGSSPSLPVVLDELIQANENQRREVIVVLSEEDPLVLAATVRDYIKDFKTTKVIYRNGSIFEVDDLKMCSISQAKSVIMVEDDIKTVKALVALSETDYFKTRKGRVAAMFSDPQTMEVAQKLIGEGGNFIHVEDALTKIMAQSCLQTGLSIIYSDLFDFAGDEIYVIDGKDVVGRSYLELQKSFTKSIPIGLIRDAKPIINPAADVTVETGDKVIVISEDDDTAVVEPIHTTNYSEAILDKARRSNMEQVRILFVGYNPRVLQVIREFDHYVKAGSKITMLMNSEVGSRKLTQLGESLDNLDVELIIGSTFERHWIEQAVTHTDGSIVIFHNAETAKDDRDSQTLLTLLHLRDIEKTADRRFEVVTEIFDVKNTKIIELAKVDDFVISNQLTSRMLTQVAENPYLVEILEILLNKNGAEVYLKPVTDYVDITRDVDGYTLVETCAKKGETFLGYKLSSCTGRACLVTNPVKHEVVRLQEHDKVIVLSED